VTTLIIGLGNPLLRDDAVGLRVARQVAAALGGREDVEVVEEACGGLRLMERMVHHFGNRTDECIYLVPNYLNLDTNCHFPTWSSDRNARSQQTFTRVNNGTHPSEPGYQQIGDSVYCWIVHALASASE